MMKFKKLMLFCAFALILSSAVNINLNVDNHLEENEINAQFDDDPRGQYLGVRNQEDQVVIPKELKLHYQMAVGDDYTTKRFYIWAGGEIMGEVAPDGVDDYGMYITLHPQEQFPAHDVLYFIIKTMNTWSGQSTDTVIDYKKFPPDANGKLEVWAMDGVAGNIDVYGTFEETQTDKITHAYFTDWKTIKVKTTGPVSSYRLYGLTSDYYGYNIVEQEKRYENYFITSGSGNDENEFEIKLAFNMPPSVVYTIHCEFTNFPNSPKTKTVGFEELYGTPRFEQFYTYDGDDLGANYTKEQTQFKLWAPMAARVELRIYQTGTPTYLDREHNLENDKYSAYKMNYMAGGVWSAIVKANLHTKYYTFFIYNNEGQSEVVDPYAKSAGVNGIRGQVLDFSLTNPEGWDSVPLVWDQKSEFDITTPSELSVYEVHIRDLTMDDTWQGKEKPGTYNAFVEKGTTYSKGSVTVTTGFDHIEELGVNAVQLLPVFDQSNNELDMEFNWGYNPLNYNVVEGGYSSDPYHGEVRVQEFKNLIQSFANNSNRTRVVMDVVYNHVSSVTTSNFTKIMPKYYFRINDEGYYTNGAGCGNEVKTEATMMRKFIVDSVKWWASEYKIKGFRFDLMGLIDTQTMREVKDALYEIDPDICVWGEGWTAAGYGGDASTHGTETDKVYSELYATTDSPGHLAAFNDQGRNAVRGGNDGGWGTNNAYPGWGFASQGSSDVSDKSRIVADMIKGITTDKGGNPIQTVNYVSCHDNFTAWDQLNYTLKESTSATPSVSDEPNPALVAKASLAAHSAVAFSQGIAFIQSGEEIFRSKEVDPSLESQPVRPYPEYPVYANDDPNIELCTPEVEMYGKIISHNSYNRSDECNSFKWDRKISIEYQGQEVSMLEYSKAFAKLFHERQNIDYHVGYPENIEIASWYDIKEESNPYGSSVIGIYLDTGYDQYWMFYSGRVGGTISYMEVGQTTLIYNSLGGSNGIIQEYGKLTLQPHVFAIYTK